MKTRKLFALSAAALLVAGCASMAPTPDYDALVAQMMAGSFRDEGIAQVDRLKQDAFYSHIMTGTCLLYGNY